jgi:hypothetical protein
MNAEPAPPGGRAGWRRREPSETGWFARLKSVDRRGPPPRSAPIVVDANRFESPAEASGEYARRMLASQASNTEIPYAALPAAKNLSRIAADAQAAMRPRNEFSQS